MIPAKFFSEDGICWDTPLVSPVEGEWDSDSCYKPSALYDEVKNRWRIWYNGRSTAREYIGLASLDRDFLSEDFE